MHKADFKRQVNSKVRRVLALFVAVMMLTGTVVYANYDEYELTGQAIDNITEATSPDYPTYNGDDNLYGFQNDDEENKDDKLYESDSNPEDKLDEDSKVTEPGEECGEKSEEDDEDCDEYIEEDKEEEYCELTLVSAAALYIPVMPISTPIPVVDRISLLEAIDDIEASALPGTIVVQNDFSIDGGIIVIPFDVDVAITSLAGQNFTLLQTTAGHGHFIVDGTLRLYNVALSGDQQNININHGGVHVGWAGALYMESGSAIANNRGSGGVFMTSNGGTLTINGGKIINNVSISSMFGGGGVSVGHNSKLIMNSGEINGNETAGSGGGVFVSPNSTFIMNGGTISGNEAAWSGGGIRVDGELTMSGGQISGNTADSGGGVMVLGQGTFTMSNGEISRNEANWGGGVAMTASGALGGTMYSGTFIMNGGIINENEASWSGGGIAVSGTFTMNNGKVNYNISGSYGGGVEVGSFGDFTMNNGEISGNTAYKNGGGVFLHSIMYPPGTFTMDGGTISNNTAVMNGGGIGFELDNDAEADEFESFLERLTIGEGAVFTDNLAQNGTRINLALHDMFENYIHPDVVSLNIYNQAFTNYDIHMPQTSLITVVFLPGVQGTLAGGTPNVVIQVLLDTVLDENHIPEVAPNIGWTHTEWEVDGVAENPIDHIVIAPIMFTAIYQVVDENYCDYCPGCGNCIICDECEYNVGGNDDGHVISGIGGNRVSHDPGPYRGHIPSNIVILTTEHTVELPSYEQQDEVIQVQQPVIYGTEAVAIVNERTEVYDIPVEVAGYAADDESVAVYTAGDIEARVNPQTNDSIAVVDLIVSAIGMLVSAAAILFARRRFTSSRNV